MQGRLAPWIALLKRGGGGGGVEEGGCRERRGADGEGERVSGPRITMKTEGGLERHRHSQTGREGMRALIIPRIKATTRGEEEERKKISIPPK